MTLKQLNQYETRDPDKLGRQLSALEDNIASEIRAVRAAFAPVPELAKLFVSDSAHASIQAQFDQQISVDSTLGAGTVLLPIPTAKDFGRVIVVIKRAGANPVTCVCVDPTVTIAGSTTPPTVAGVTRFYCDEAGYWT